MRNIGLIFVVVFLIIMIMEADKILTFMDDIVDKIFERLSGMHSADCIRFGTGLFLTGMILGLYTSF